MSNDNLTPCVYYFLLININKCNSQQLKVEGGSVSDYVILLSGGPGGAQWSGRPCEVDIGMTKGYDIPQNMFSRGYLAPK